MAKAGTLLKLTKHQVTGFVNGRICPFCKYANIIFRSWRGDYICGYCQEVFELSDGQVRSLGNQRRID